MMYKLLLIFLFSIVSVFPQRMLKLDIAINGKTEKVSYLPRKGLNYVSSKEIAHAISGNYFYNKDADKIEIKFSNNSLTYTARNQFVVFKNRITNEKTVYQIPVSTLLVNQDVLIPLEYSIPLLEKALDQKIDFDTRNKIISISGLKSPIAVNNSNENATGEIVEVKIPKKDTKTNSKYDVYSISIDEKSNGTLVVLQSQKKIKKYSTSLLEDKLIVFLTGVSVDPSALSKVKPTGLIKSVKSKYVSGSIQLEFKLKPGFSTHDASEDIASNDIFISIHNDMLNINSVKDFSAEKEKWKFDVVVIDAGHGGKDPGAIGITGVKEKDINLGIALKLGKLIKEKMPDVKVVYTRDDDRFIELYKRGKIANDANGKLFVSIHCNSLGKKNSSTRGFEVYLLRPGRTKEAIEIAEFENSVIKLEANPDKYKQLTDENFILVSMAHSAYMRYSEKFSDVLNSNWGKYVKIPSRGIKQAGFYVLVGASMPGVLVETGFLSNKQDEAILKSSSGQNDIANAIFNSIKSYRTHYEKELEAEVN